MVTRISALATSIGAPSRSSEPRRKKLPLAPTIEPYRNASGPWDPPKLRLTRKLSHLRTPQEWSRHAGASTRVSRPSSTTVPLTRHDVWKLLEKIAPAAPLDPANAAPVAAAIA